VPAVGLQTILRNPILCHKYFPIVTPLIHERWTELLTAAGCLEEFADVPKGIRDGFRLGAAPTLSHTFIPKNHKSALDHPSVVSDYIAKEMAAGRYSEPFDPDTLASLIGPYSCSPLGVAEHNDKFRVIQDHSFPRGDPERPSLNSLIDTSVFEYDWASFAECYLYVADAPPGTQVGSCPTIVAFTHCFLGFCF
jgi:hypothetical protein